MTAQKPTIVNFFQTQLTANVGATDTTFSLGSVTGLAVPCYLVFNPTVAARREVIEIDSSGSVGASSVTCSSITKRFLSGSAAASGLTHTTGDRVWMVPLKQHITDIFDYIDAHITDTSAAHAASAVSYAGSTNLSSTDVEAALDELDTEKAPLASPTFTGTVTLPGDPATDLVAADKRYVDIQVSVKRVRAATTANGTLSTAFANGQTIDGVTLATGDRILLKNQSTASDNGIYIVAASGAPARAGDWDTTAKALPNTLVAVAEGTVNADTLWELTTNATITLGSTNLTFSQISALKGAAQGDIVYFNGTNWVILPKGSDTQVLTLASSVPSWATPSAAAEVSKELGYAAATSNQNGIGTSDTDVTSLSTTVTADGTHPIQIECLVHLLKQTTGSTVYVAIKEGATVLVDGTTPSLVAGGTTGSQFTMILKIRLVPSAASHTYKVTVAATAGTVDCLGASASPEYIRAVQAAT